MSLFEFSLNDTVIYFNRYEFDTQGKTKLLWDGFLVVERMLNSSSDLQGFSLVHWNDREDSRPILGWNRRLITNFKKSFTKKFRHPIYIRKNVIYKRELPCKN